MHHTGEEKRKERYKVRIKNSCDQPTISEFIKKITDFLGLKNQAKKFGIGSLLPIFFLPNPLPFIRLLGRLGIGSFDVKLYRLATVSQKVENYAISTQQQLLNLELPFLIGSDFESELNGKLLKIYLKFLHTLLTT